MSKIREMISSCILLDVGFLAAVIAGLKAQPSWKGPTFSTSKSGSVGSSDGF
jgi:hypothetical protein